MKKVDLVPTWMRSWAVVTWPFMSETRQRTVLVPVVVHDLEALAVLAVL